METKVRKLVALSVASAATAGGVVGTASPAAADPTVCEPGEVCFWSGNFGGAFDQMSGGLADDPDLSNNSYDTDTSRFLANTVSSFHNRTTDKYIALYRETGYQDFIGCFAPNMSWVPEHGFGDDIESMRVTTLGSSKFDAICDPDS